MIVVVAIITMIIIITTIIIPMFLACDRTQKINSLKIKPLANIKIHTQYNTDLVNETQKYDTHGIHY